MIAAVVLVLTVMAPDRTVRTESVLMPSLALCRAAEREFLSYPVAAVSGVPLVEPPKRWAHCVALAPHGMDA